MPLCPSVPVATRAAPASLSTCSLWGSKSESKKLNPTLFGGEEKFSAFPTLIDMIESHHVEFFKGENDPSASRTDERLPCDACC